MQRDIVTYYVESNSNVSIHRTGRASRPRKIHVNRERSRRGKRAALAMESIEAVSFAAMKQLFQRSEGEICSKFPRFFHSTP